MSLQFFDGFEALPNVKPGVVVSAASATTTGRDGVGKAIQASAAGGTLVTDSVPTPAGQIIFGCGRRPPAGAFNNTAAAMELFSILADGGAVAHLSANLDSTGRITLRRGTSTQTIIATGTPTLTGGSWCYMEVKATINDTTGICIIKIDGVEHINFTGDTRNAGTSTNIDTIALGIGTSTAPYPLDDVYICDSGGSDHNNFLGDRVIKGIRPAANGALSQLVGSDGNSVDNYANVDEDPFSLTDYNGSANVGDRDSYDMSAVAGLTSVDATQVIIYASKTDSGTRNIKTLTRNAAGTVATSSTIPLSTTATTYAGTLRQTDPDGAAWTQASVNSSEFGVEIA